MSFRVRFLSFYTDLVGVFRRFPFRKNLKFQTKSVYFRLSLAFFFWNTGFQGIGYAKPKSKPLVLQWEVSHPRNTDQISLIFRRNTVELVVNTSSWRKERNEPRLGRFGSDMTPALRSLKRRIQRSYNRLQQTVSYHSLIGDPRFRPSPSPHAPRLRINGKEIKEGHPYFEPLADIIRRTWQQEWICLECAIYKRKGAAILRTARMGLGLGAALKRKDLGGVQKKTFSTKDLNCVPKAKRRMECVDSQFGIFEL